MRVAQHRLSAVGLDRSTQAIIALSAFLLAVVPSQGQIQSTNASGLKQMPRRGEVPVPSKNQMVSAEIHAKPAGNKPVVAENEKIQTRADSMMYRKEKGIIEARGDVLIKKGDQELTADFVIVNTVTEEADAYGNVVIKRGSEVWRGERLHYNFKLGMGDSEAMSYSAEPFRLKANKVERLPGNVVKARSASVTTCEHGFTNPHFVVRARELIVDPGKSIKGKHTVFFFGPVPFLYLPYWYRDLDADTGWRFKLGYRSNWGGYLLSSYRYSMTETLRGETHLDYRTERGVAAGQDFGWGTDSSQGAVELYYANDDKPLDEDDDPAKDIDASRYRIKVKNTSAIDARNSIFLQAEFVSDMDMREDFFEPDYRESVQPDNYLVYSHRGDHYTLDVLGRSRLNDFYAGVNRIPEVSFNALRQPLADTLLYYESQTYISNLERVHTKESGTQDYSALRMDTAHLVNYPDKYFGYLTVIPRVGARATHYSATMQSTTVDTTVPVVITNATTGAVTSGVQTNSTTVLSDGPGKLRTRFELGCEASLKAYRTWGGAAAPRRHVVQPYANYTFVPEPSVLPGELYQFDGIDQLTKSHTIQLGVRNKYQRKFDDMPFDIIDLNIYTILDLDPQGDRQSFNNLYFDGRLQPGAASLVTFDGFYDTDAAQLSRFNARLEYGLEHWWQIGGEYHYSVDSSSLISADVTFMPDSNWTWNVYGRYEGETGRMEEEGGYIQRNLDCMSVRTRVSVLPGYTKSSGSVVDDEWRVMFEFWLTAFPEMRISARHGG